jgi:hypothetical protein
MTKTYEKIATTTLGSAAATVTFSSIPATYTDLVLIISGAKTNTGNSDVYWQANSDTSSLYSQTSLYGNGSAAGSDRGSGTYARNGRIGSDRSNSILNFQNYANTNVFKTCISRGNTAGYLVITNVGLYRSTNAISSLTLGLADGDTYVSGTVFTIYGIKAE